MTDKIKVVKLNKKYQTNASNIEAETEKVQEIIENTFLKFMNEENYNTMGYAQECLINEYTYIPNDIILTEGRYIRYLDLKNVNKIKLRLGGFVIIDNGFSVTIKGTTRNFKVDKRNIVIFSKISDTDRIRDAVNDYI